MPPAALRLVILRRDLPPGVDRAWYSNHLLGRQPCTLPRSGKGRKAQPVELFQDLLDLVRDPLDRGSTRIRTISERARASR